MSNISDHELLFCLKVPNKQTESVKQQLLKTGVFLKNYKLLKDRDYIYLPIDYSPDTSYDWPVKQRLFTQLKSKLDYHTVLQNILPSILHEFIPTSFDRIGPAILIKLDPHLANYYHIIGSELLKQFNVQSVYTKTGDVDTDYRTITWQCIAGVDDPVVIHKMHGLRFKVNLTAVYFNTRLSNEYLRIATMCQDNDVIIDMFSGVGPFALLCAFHKKVEIFAIDINPAAIQLLKENISLNTKHLQGTIQATCGDSKELIKSLPKAHIIIMNLPGLAIEFLASAIDHVADHGTIFLHQFIHLSKEEKKLDLTKPQRMLEAKITQIINESEKLRYTFEILGKKLRDVSPSKTHVVWDIRLSLG